MDENIIHKYVNRLSGNILIFNRTNEKFKVYHNDRERDADPNFINPMEISEFSIDLIRYLLVNSNANVRYNSTRILKSQIDRGLYKREDESELLDILNAQITLEKNKRTKALVTNVIYKKLKIPLTDVIALVKDALEIEQDKWWEFELASIFFMLEKGDPNGEAIRYIRAYETKYGFTSIQGKTIRNMTAYYTIFNSIMNLTTNVKDIQESVKKQPESEDKKDLEKKVHLLENEIISIKATLEKEPRLSAKQLQEFTEKETLWQKWGGEILGSLIGVILGGLITFLLTYYLT